ncbi:MAG: PAS-domain containing protein [Rhodoblastus sp.]
MESHARTLDQLPTAVAIFDGQKRLVFHNAAYRQLWALPQGFLRPGTDGFEISTGCAPSAACRSRRISARGRPASWPPISRRRRASICGMSRAVAPSASSPTRARTAA